MYKTLSQVTWFLLKLVGRVVWLSLRLVAPPLARRFQRQLTGKASAAEAAS